MAFVRTLNARPVGAMTYAMLGSVGLRIEPIIECYFRFNIRRSKETSKMCRTRIVMNNRRFYEYKNKTYVILASCFYGN